MQGQSNGCRGPDCAGGTASEAGARMMRQYDLVERVRSYNPNTNEDLLNRAYVYAMKAHGSQTRASGDPYSRTRSKSRRFSTELIDDATISPRCCTIRSRTPRRRGRRSTSCSAPKSARWSRA